MARSLGLAAYRAFARRAETDPPRDLPPRPRGELLWLHAAEPGNLLPVQDLALRLGAARSDVSLLVTHSPDVQPPPPPRREGLEIIQIPVCGEHPQAVDAFLDHWRPDGCLWVWGALRPNLITGAAARGCEMLLIDADTQGFDGRRDRWLPHVARQVLSAFSVVLARSAAARKRLMQLAPRDAKIEVTAPLMAGGQPLPCADSDLEDLSAALKGRPVWFAAQVLPREVPAVLTAHQQALRLSHRLLLVLNPDTASQLDDLRQRTGERNLTTANWSDGDMPDDATQVLIAEEAGDRGLFFRIAPVSFLGSSLVAGRGGCDPFDASTLGSAVLYGPNVRNFMPSYTRLAAAGAARIVNDAGALGTAVSHLIAPDQAAAMAHAGWDVISQGAEVTDRIIDLVQDRLDMKAGQA
ncbi:MAG: glycosyltransferase N-terminal domain-containing protein [Sulfitobacter sp.]|nr:glycosyltransferase N-terminal domain-containing protein [Sulfitobacter sp.]